MYIKYRVAAQITGYTCIILLLITPLQSYLYLLMLQSAKPAHSPIFYTPNNSD